MAAGHFGCICISSKTLTPLLLYFPNRVEMGCIQGHNKGLQAAGNRNRDLSQSMQGFGFGCCKVQEVKR